MKISDLFLTVFLLSVSVVFYAMITVNIDVFMWAAFVADIVGIIGLVMSSMFGKKYYQKIW